MRLLAEITFKRPKDRDAHTMHFYEYEGVHFRDLLYLNSESEMIDSMHSKLENCLFENLESNYMQFLAVSKKYNAELIEHKFMKPEYKEEIYALKS